MRGNLTPNPFPRGKGNKIARGRVGGLVGGEFVSAFVTRKSREGE